MKWAKQGFLPYGPRKIVGDMGRTRLAWRTKNASSTLFKPSPVRWVRQIMGWVTVCQIPVLYICLGGAILVSYVLPTSAPSTSMIELDLSFNRSQPDYRRVSKGFSSFPSL